MAFCLVRKGPQLSGYIRFGSSQPRFLRQQNVSAVSSLSRFTANTSTGLLSTSLPSSAMIISKHCFSTSKPQLFFLAKQDPNIDPECGQPYTHPVKGDLVYSGPLTKSVKKLKILSLVSSGFGLALFPTLLAGKLTWFIIGGLGIAVFITPLLIHFIVAKKYVTEIYFNDKTKKFNMGTISFFLRRKETEFTADDVIVPDVAGVFSAYRIKGKDVFFNRTLFTSKEVYKHMVGYDKPFDFGIPTTIDMNSNNPATQAEIEELNKKIKSKLDI